MTWKHFKKLKKRYWSENLPFYSDSPEIMVSDLTKVIDAIEGEAIGTRCGDKYFEITQLRTIFRGLRLKILYFLLKSITDTDAKDYISAISLHKMCLEHIVMRSFLIGKFSKYLKDKNYKAFYIALLSSTMGYRMHFVDLVDKKNNQKQNTRAEHVNDAIRYCDKKYPNYKIKALYDQLNEHCHVTPTSAVRMLYRQKIWNRPEPSQNFETVWLSTTSNSNEKFATTAIQFLLTISTHVDEDFKESIYNKMDAYENLIELLDINRELNPNLERECKEIIIKQTKVASDWLNSLVN